jgi:beta-1,4-mannosyltransferase
LSSSLPRRRQPPPLPAILAIITGKGPQRQHYLECIAALEAQGKLGGGSSGVTVVAAWLPLRDYAALLGAADLGVSLHVSSSGVDLPMKVLDMFGAGLPVVGWCDGDGGSGGLDGDEDGGKTTGGGGFASAWGELVKEGVNGRGFGDAAQLGRLLIELFGGQGQGQGDGGGEGQGGDQLRRLRQGALAEGRTRWDDVWQPVAGRILGLA